MNPGSLEWQEYRGHIAMRYSDDSERVLVIDHADPRIRVSARMLAHIARGDVPGATLAEGVLRIEASNRKVIYRIGEPIADVDAYYAEWPD